MGGTLLLSRRQIPFPAEYTRSDGTCLKRLDVRGTHRDRATGEDYINRTHKHRWSRARGDKDVYAPDDIRHNPDPILGATLASMDEEYDRGFPAQHIQRHDVLSGLIHEYRDTA